jgi:hydroxyethylthiazole kinase-like uncharacterized protein yjeF
MDEQTIREQLTTLLIRSPEAHKYDFGHILIIGGSPGMVGAPLLCGRAALRSGAGLVTIASVIADKLAGLLPEAMTYQLNYEDNETLQKLSDFIAERQVRVVVIGPGLTVEGAVLVQALAQKLDLPVVLDGGALAAFTDNLELLKTATAHNKQIVLTPHAGEYSKLSGQPKADNHDAAIQQANTFANENQLILVLKGHQTIVAAPDLASYSNTTGNPGLATAGSGDVLSGIIAALLGQGLSAATAAAGGVYLHGLAADMATEHLTQPGLIASDIISYVPAALSSMPHAPKV